ncbi:PP2C family protein-serine/threonine phosphatase [Azoarcus olearius]|uniref:Phosphoprotein phosphatase n=1 Tax=Azoarcus sp. (strain BH72) TaxID=418699 RepID=A1K464_AZOSB|nr:protein phosphatase 2C domain-containing protein [Azoarcus olearius]ANQ84167.1 putative phosphoprotein phosphatase [Azoarcus olearius]CAL93619.1 putative phosphoprotein phosphatase [Azoarcus olearius]
MPLIAETCVARHTGDRKEQQDRVALFAHPTETGTLLAVLADGMGGHSGGAMAAEQVTIKAKQNFEAFQPAHETGRHLLQSIVDEAHVVIKLTRFTSEQDPHSTAVVFLMQPGKAAWAHCGDSRLYHFRGREPCFRTQDHSLVGEMLRKGRLDEAGALNHPQRNVLLSCLGSEREPRVEYGETDTLMAGDSFLLCSDGLWSYFSDDELGLVVDNHRPREAAQLLIDLARSRAGGYGDNISLALIKLSDPKSSPRPAFIG